MAKLLFTADYNHRWPSGAITAYKAGMCLTVKREVSSVAIDKGRAKWYIPPKDDEDGG